MKKVIALVLAVALSLSMAAVAFAAPVLLTDGVANPGDKMEIDVLTSFTTPSGASAITADYISTDYFSIKVEYSRGKELVKDVKFDNGKLVITLKDSLEERPSVPNFQIEKITLTGKKNGVDETYRNKKFECNVTGLTTTKKVGYVVDDTNYVVGNDFTAPDNVIVKMAKTSSGDKYGTSVISFGSYASAEVRLYEKEKFFLGVEVDPDLDIVKANPDADIEFRTFKGNPSFSSNATVEIYADEDRFLYELKDGKLVESSLKYDKDAGAFTGKVRTLGKYVISDMKLVAAATAEETKNPDTGANDVVGVAVALAVVSLVAAGAVSLKK